MLERLRDRFGAQPRWKLAAAALVIFASVAVVVSAGGQPPVTTSPPATPEGASVVVGGRQTVPAAATAAARRFLARYLRFLYGQATADGLESVTPQLRHWLAMRQGRVTPAERTRRPRVVGLGFVRGDLSRTVLFEAEVDDGGSRYRLRLRVARHRGGWWVVELPDADTAVGPNGAD